MELQLDRIESALGEICVVTDGAALCALDFSDCEAQMRLLLARRFGEVGLRPARAPDGLRERFDAYFGGELGALDGIEVDSRGTPFQETVWRALRGVAPGETISYGKLAARIGRPAAARAVGLANRLNPVALVIPCHRVIGADGALTGYAGGLDRKRWLLEHEGALRAEPSFRGIRQRSLQMLAQVRASPPPSRA